MLSFWAPSIHIKVYVFLTVDPQGLKGASEGSYEKLLRIFGDMVQEGRLAQMADGLHVLGNSIHELAKQSLTFLIFNSSRQLNYLLICKMKYQIDQY